MNIALIGATGYVGSRILNEALARGHALTAIVRRPEELAARPGLTARRGDVEQDGAFASLLLCHDAAISAYNPGAANGSDGIRAIIDAAKRAGVRLLVVGGAGSLDVEPGRRLVDTPDFPAAWKAGALATARFLDALRQEPDLDWTFLSPAAKLSPGARTGRYRAGRDMLLTGADGESRISLEDYAAAMLDEAERPKHRRMRFTVAY